MKGVGVRLLRAIILGLTLVLSPNFSPAQDTTKHPHVGIISNDGPGPVFDALRQGFAQLGYVEGRNIAIEGRFAHGNLDRVPQLAAELVGLNVDVIVSLGAVGAQAARKASPTTPIVFVGAIDPIAVGFAATLERSGGSVTGITSFDPQQARKQFELLKQVVPNLSRVAILSDQDIPRVDGWNPLEKVNDAAARAAGVQPQWLKVKGPAPDLEEAFAAMKSERAEVLLVLECSCAHYSSEAYRRPGGQASRAHDVSRRSQNVECWRFGRLWDGPSGHVSSHSSVRGQDPEGRQTG